MPGRAARHSLLAVADENAAKPTIHIQVPEDLVNGTFSDLVSVWHSPYGFTMDFAVFNQPMQDEEGNPVLVANVVARMKIPANVIFQIARAIADNVNTYEDVYGSITPLPADGSAIPRIQTQEEHQETNDDDDGNDGR